MKVTRLNIAGASFVCINTGTVSMDVRLTSGMTVKDSLAETVTEMRDRAARLLNRANLIEEASKLIGD